MTTDLDKRISQKELYIDMKIGNQTELASYYDVVLDQNRNEDLELAQKTFPFLQFCPA